MRQTDTPTLDITTLLSQELQLPPVCAGQRLRSERELAQLLGVNRNQLRQSLDQLVADGILVRRHGSGTYVRRVPDAMAGVAPGRQRRLALTVDDQRDPIVPLQPVPEQKMLHLELWSGFHQTNLTNRTILESMLARANQIGHQLTVHSIIRREDVPLNEDELTKRLESSPCDGYLVTAALGSLFRRAFLRAFGTRRPPTVYVAPGSNSVDYEPMIMLDTNEAIFRAVRILAGEGFRHIGFVAIQSALHPWSSEADVYQWAMGRQRLVYRPPEYCVRTREGGREGMARLLDRPVRPDAVYVANDEVFPGVLDALAEKGLEPGRDIGIITLSTTCKSLPPGKNWSHIQFDPAIVGRDAVDNLVRVIQTAGEQIHSEAHLGTWHPGTTHLHKS